MARITVIDALSEIWPVDARELIYGEADDVAVRVRDSNGAPIDLTGFSVDCAVEFFMADVAVDRVKTAPPKSTLRISDFTLHESQPRTLPASITSATDGTVAVAVPSDLCPGNPDVDAVRTLVGLVYVQRLKSTTRRTTRALLIYRRGPS